MKQKSKRAFSLAEVTLVMAIIGVVAALTIPSLINSTKEREFYTAYKKAFNVASSALDNQIAESKYYRIKTQNKPENEENVRKNFKQFSTYFRVVKECFNNNNQECWNENGEKLYEKKYPRKAELAFVDVSGMAWSLFSNWENILLVDTNGMKGPNEYGKDRWYLIPVDVNGIREGANSKEAAGLGIYCPLAYLGMSCDMTSYEANWCQHPPCRVKSALMK